MIDGTVSTLAPIFAAALVSGSHAAFIVGLATTIGAGISMGFSEALSDDGKTTGRGQGKIRGLITGTATSIGGIFHTLPFLISNTKIALIIAIIIVLTELSIISFVRHKFLKMSLLKSFVSVTIGGIIVVIVGLLLGST